MFYRWCASLSLILVLVLSATSAAQDYDALRDYHHVELEEIQRETETYKNTQVKFKIYFRRVDDMWSRFFSPFDESNYLNFSGWSAQKHLWRKEHMVKDFPFLYLRNEAEAVGELLSANKYDLLQVKGTVTSTFRDHPWIEIRHVDIIRSNAYTNKQLQYLMLAGQANKKEQPTEATRYFEKGLKTNPLTRHDRAEVLKQLAINYYKAQDYRNALRNVEKYEDTTGERNDLLHRIRKRSREFMKMSPEKRNAELNKETENQDQESNKTGVVPDIDDGKDHATGTTERKYTTLLSQYEELISEYQTLEAKHASVKEQKTDLAERVTKTKSKVTSLKQQKQELKQKLSQAYQKNARLLAKLRKRSREHDTEKKRTLSRDATDTTEETSRDPGSDVVASSEDSSNQSKFNHDQEKLLSRIRILKRRNQSLRSQMSTLSDQQAEAKREIKRLRDQVQLETSAATETSSTTTQDKGS